MGPALWDGCGRTDPCPPLLPITLSGGPLMLPAGLPYPESPHRSVMDSEKVLVIGFIR